MDKTLSGKPNIMTTALRLLYIDNIFYMLLESEGGGGAHPLPPPPPRSATADHDDCPKSEDQIYPGSSTGGGGVFSLMMGQQPSITAPPRVGHPQGGGA